MLTQFIMYLLVMISSCHVLIRSVLVRVYQSCWPLIRCSASQPLLSLIYSQVLISQLSSPSLADLQAVARLIGALRCLCLFTGVESLLSLISVSSVLIIIWVLLTAEH